MAVKIFNINSYAASKTALNQILKSQINMLGFVVVVVVYGVAFFFGHTIQSYKK